MTKDPHDMDTQSTDDGSRPGRTRAGVRFVDSRAPHRSHAPWI